MYNVMIVDDDLLIRSNLKYLFNSTESGYRCVAEANNGKQALEILENTGVDIVLTDMRMPVMNGVELSRRIRELYPHIMIAAISNYDDFELVQSALRAGVKDYLLKHNIERESLFYALNELVKTQRKEDYKKELSDDSISALKNRFIMNLLTGLTIHEDTALANIKFLDLPIGLTNLLPIVLRVQRNSDNDTLDRSLFEFSIINMCTEILKNTCEGVIIPIHDFSYCILLYFPHIYSNSSVKNTAHIVLNKIRDVLRRFMNIDICYSMGEFCAYYTEVAGSFSMAEKAFPKRIMFVSDDTAIEEQNGVVKDKNQIKRPGDRRDDLIDGFEKALQELEVEKACGQLEKLFLMIRQEKYDRLATQVVFGEIVHSIKRICKTQKIKIDEMPLTELSGVMLQEEINLNDVKENIVQFVKRMCEQISIRRQRNLSDYTIQAVNIMRKRYDEDISLSLVAEEIGISHSYLSTVFKNELKCSYSEYLLKIRLEKAIGLMEAGERNIRKIAERSGFNSYEYFFSVFKKTYGVTPKEYVKGGKKQDAKKG